MRKSIVLLGIILVTATAYTQQKFAFALTGGLNYSSYNVVRTSYSKIPGSGFPADAKDLPSLQGGIGYGIGLDVDYAISKSFRLMAGAGYESEQFIVNTGTLRKPLPDNYNLYYNSRKNRLQQLIDINWGIGYEIVLRNDQKLMPSLSVGTTIGITEKSDPYSYVMPAIKWYPFENWYIGSGIKIGDHGSELKTADYTGENITVTEFQYRVVSVQLLIGCTLK